MLNFKNIDELLDWVNHQKKFTSLVPTLDKMNFLMGLFNHPEKNFPTIHVTGTNGKGSTVSYLKNIYLEKGLNVATFTSPYVTRFNERINYNNQDISDEDLLRIANMVVSKYDLLLENNFEIPTFFEFITTCAFIYFGEIKELDLAIIEVGMGGRLDATNIITPLCSIITNVSYDHMEVLGDSLDKILKEKLGIVKEHIPFVTSINDPLLLKDIDCFLENKDIPYGKVDSKKLKIKKIDISSSIFSYDGFEYEINLPGDYQINNACCAIECVKMLNFSAKSKFHISSELLYRGLKNTTWWPGRFEKIMDKPLIYLDGGHNIDCITKVCDFIKQMNIKNSRAICSISNDKLKEEMVKKLDNTFDEIIFTSYTYTRSASAKDLYDLSTCSKKKVIENINEAISYVLTNPQDFNIFIGSLYLVSEVRNILINKKNK